MKPKYKGLSVVERVDLSSAEEERNTPFPIASISKSFCGAVCALMAVDDKLGEDGIDSTLHDTLEEAKTRHPERIEQIDEYQKMLSNRGFSDVKISELLTHRSGCRDADEIAPSAYYNRSPLEFFSDHLGRGKCKRGEYRYSNVGYSLLEEVVNLVSDKGSYKQELQERIFDRLGLANTGLLEDSLDPKSLEADKHLSRAVFIPGSKESPHSDQIIEVHTEFPANHTTPLGAVHASCGGLYSSVSDLEKFSEELGKLIIGRENSLTDKAENASRLYRDRLGDNSEHYSLGVEFEKVKLSEGEERCVMKHKGLFPGNFALMSALLPCSFEQLESTAVIATDGQLRTDIFLQKFDYMVSSLFTEKAEAIPTEMIKRFVSSRLDEKEKVSFADAPIDEIEKYLIERDRLPKNFSRVRAEIADGFKPAGERVKELLRDNYLNEDGVIDSARIAADFHTTEDVDRVIEPFFAVSR
jgi:CubicO group peptidase (beta-lactamase class C family)